jgi:hypothetical protein
MNFTKKDRLLMLVLHAVLVMYIAVVGIIYKEQNFYMTFNGSEPLSVWYMLIVMFLLELLSTLTFTLRIYYTDKSFKLAAVFGTLSWIIAGFQGIIFITGDINFGINSLSFLYSFLTKIPVIGLATFGGIYFNLKYLTPAINKRNIKI